MSVQENASKGAENGIDAGSIVQTNLQELFAALHKSHAVVEFAADGAVMSANQNFLDLVGYKENEVVGQNRRIFCDAAYAESDAYSDTWMRLTMGEAITSNFECLKKDGSAICLSAFYTPVMGADGKLASVVVLAVEGQEATSDITNLRKTTSFETSTAAMMVVDRDFIVTDVNQATKDLMARSADAFAKVWPDFDPSQIIGTCIDRFHKDPAHQRKMLSDPANLPHKTDITIGDFKFALNVGGVFDESGAYVGNTLEWADVTEARMNAGVLNALDKAQAVIEFGLDGIIQNANENFVQTTGYTLDELQGQDHRMFVDEEYASSEEYANFWHELAAGQPQEGQFKRFRKGGAVLWLQAIYNPIFDGNGKVFKVVKFATDITAQKEIEAINLRKTTGYENSTAAMMTVDRDFIVTDVNGATKELMAKRASAFAEVWPDFDPANIIGTCIDQFHKNPAHQRKLLSDPKNLPWKTDITIGDFKFALNVGGIFDEAGDYVGNMLEWDDVTEARLNAGVLSALDRAQSTMEFTPDGKITGANANMQQLTGYSEDELVGHTHAVIVDGDYAKSPEHAAFWEKLAKGETQDGEFKRFGKDKAELWLQATYNPIVDGNGHVFKVVMFATDVTEQVKLRKVAQTLSLVANETDNSVIITDKEGRIEYVNPGFCKLTGFTSEEVIGRKPGDFLQGPLTDPNQKQNIADQLAHQKPFLAEILNYSKDGKAYWINLAVNPVFGEDGVLERFVSIQTNITETKEEQLDFYGKLEAISRASAVIEFKPDGTILSANENFTNATGYSLDEIKGKHHRMFCDPEYTQSPEYTAFWEKLRGGEFASGKFKRFKKGGDELWLQASYSPILNSENQVTKVVKFASDITIAVELEKEVTRISSEFVSKSQSISEQAEKVAGGAQTLGCTTEEISASIEELSASIDSIAQNGRTSDEIAQRTKTEADIGAQAIDRSIESMDLINASSEQINEIVKVISEIAGQTNMLAFNAAIEAARAGEHGLGFSVVADEVRKLAERSSQATKEISKLITETVKRVTQGSEVSREAGAAFKKILDGIAETTDSISQISVAANEQQTAARDVAEAVQSIVEASEEAVIASDKIASSTNELNQGAQALKVEVSKLGA